MIVKVQRPLMPPPPIGEALIYDEDHDFHAAVPWAWVEPFMGDDLKQYREASFDSSTGIITFGERVPEECW